MIFFYVSTVRTDKCSIITIIGKNVRRADKIINKKFNDWGYKGKPQRIAI